MEHEFDLSATPTDSSQTTPEATDIHEQAPTHEEMPVAVQGDELALEQDPSKTLADKIAPEQDSESEASVAEEDAKAEAAPSDEEPAREESKPDDKAIPPFLRAASGTAHSPKNATPRKTTANTQLMPLVAELTSSFEPLDATTDEVAALNSLDVTMRRPLPDFTSLWAEEECRRQVPAEQDQPRLRIPTGVLMAVVAAVSFFAGGMTARMSAQMPLLFAERPAATEVTASYQQAPAVEQEQQTPEPEPEATDTWNETPADNGWNTTPAPQTEDSTEESYPQSDERSDTPDEHDGWDDDDNTGSDDATSDTTYQWYFGPDGNSISYDREHGQVTIDIDDSEISFNVEDPWSQPDSSQDDRGYGYPRPYGDDTGYDVGQGWGDSYT